MSEASLGRRVALGASIAVLIGALSPPTEAAAQSSLSLHMVQHVALLVVVPALLVASMTPPARTTGVGVAAAALVVQTAVMWSWHVPALYDAADRADWLHIVEHLSFLLAGFGFWWSIRTPRAGSALLLFLAALPGTLLGAGMTLASHPWYAAYPRLGDQQVAGVVMWGFASAVYVLAAGILFARWVATGGDRPVLEVTS